MTAPAPEGVFINCPFDDAYRPVHDGIVMTVVACGFDPRSALESDTAALPRMKRISRALAESRYSVHDLTRAYGDPAQDNLARFNMPFEFGMAYQRTEDSGGAGVVHDWLALVPHDHPHAEFISDVAAYDLKSHSGAPESVIPPLMGWLSTRPTALPQPSGLNPASLINLLPEMQSLVAAKNLDWAGHLPWIHLVGVVRDLLAARVF